MSRLIRSGQNRSQVLRSAFDTPAPTYLAAIMNRKAFASVALLLVVEGAFAQSLYLTCKTLSGPNPKTATVYKVVPAGPQKQFINDMIAEGLVGLLLSRPDSWVVDLSERRISSPAENSGFSFSDASITETKIAATHHTAHGMSYSYDLNRITGNLTYRAYLSKEIVSSWRKKHGGALPTVWQWEQKCSSASRPAI